MESTNVVSSTLYLVLWAAPVVSYPGFEQARPMVGLDLALHVVDVRQSPMLLVTSDGLLATTAYLRDRHRLTQTRGLQYVTHAFPVPVVNEPHSVPDGTPCTLCVT